jgi:hypothetical protein
MICRMTGSRKRSTLDRSAEKSRLLRRPLQGTRYAYGDCPTIFCAVLPRRWRPATRTPCARAKAAMRASRRAWIPRDSGRLFRNRPLTKANALTPRHGVSITTAVADLADFDPGVGRWDLVASIFAPAERHAPVALLSATAQSAARRRLCSRGQGRAHCHGSGSLFVQSRLVINALNE